MRSGFLNIRSTQPTKLPVRTGEDSNLRPHVISKNSASTAPVFLNMMQISNSYRQS